MGPPEGDKGDLDLAVTAGYDYAPARLGPG